MVYLVHLDKKLGQRAQHYLGYTQAESVEARMNRHKTGTGARMLAAAVQIGIDFDVVRTWEGGRTLERSLKRRKNARKLCPTCLASGKEVCHEVVVEVAVKNSLVTDYSIPRDARSRKEPGLSIVDARHPTCQC